MGARKLMSIAWPAFLAACVLQVAVFAFVDPLELHWFGRELDWSRQAVYAAGFFVFWAVGFLLGGGLTESAGFGVGAGELALLFGLLGVGGCFAFNIYLLQRSGQSIGKIALGTRIVTTTGEAVPLFATVMKRSIFPALIGGIPVLGNLFNLLDSAWVFGQERRCLHDLMANTIVVQAAASTHVYADRR